MNGRQLVTEPEWTRVRSSLKQRSVIDYVITDSHLMNESGVVQVDSTDIGPSNHFLVWIELCRTTKCSKKGKRVIRRWRLDRFVDDDVNVNYRDALQAELSAEPPSIRIYSYLVQNCLIKYGLRIMGG